MCSKFYNLHCKLHSYANDGKLATDTERSEILMIETYGEGDDVWRLESFIYLFFIQIKCFKILILSIHLFYSKYKIN